MNSNELLDALKKHTGAPSDYALARDVLHVDPMSLKGFRQRGLSDERAFQIATIMGLDPAPLLATIHAERARDPKVRKVWEHAAKSLKSAAAGLVAVAGAYLAMRWGVDSDASGALLLGIAPGIHYTTYDWDGSAVRHGSRLPDRPPCLCRPRFWPVPDCSARTDRMASRTGCAPPGFFRRN